MTLTCTILADLKARAPSVIGVDGVLGGGKTLFANRIAEFLNCECIHLDSYLTQGTGSFVASIRYEQLRLAIECAHRPVVIEGVCLLQVLARIGVAVDHLVYIDPQPEYRFTKRASLLGDELAAYFAGYAPRDKATTILTLEATRVAASSYDVDIAYLRLKTVLAVILAIGGIIQTLVGAMLLNTGLNSQGTATLKVMGAEFSATGFGAVILCTSVMWAYLAFLSRPKFSSRSESKSTMNADGSSEVSEFRSSTQVTAMPRVGKRGDK